MKHIRQGVAAGTSRLVDYHHLRSVDSSDGRSRGLAVALREVPHQFSIQLVHYVVRDLAAVIISLVNNRALFVLLRIVIASEVGITGTGCVRKPNVRQSSV